MTKVWEWNRVVFFLVLLSFTGVIGLLWVTSSHRYEPETEVGADSEQGEKPGLVMQQVHMVERRDGQREWEILSERMSQHSDETHFAAVERLTLYRSGEPRYDVSAEEGIWLRKQEELVLTGQVEVFGPDDFVMQTSRLVWFPQTQQVHVDQPVRVDYDQAEIQAEGLSMDILLDQAVFQGPVTVVDGRQQWVADQLIYYLEDRIMEFRGATAGSFGAE